MLNSHQIRNLSFEIESNSEKTARDNIHTLESLIKRRLLGSIQRVFDELPLEDATLRIEALTLDLGVIDIHRLDSEIEYKLRHALNEHLSLILRSQPEVMQQFQASVEPDIKKTEDWLQTYLTTGIIPWWKQIHQLSREKIIEEIHHLFRKQPEKLRTFIGKNISYPQVFRRILIYTSPDFLAKITGFDVLLAEKLVRNITEIIDQNISSSPSLYSPVLSSAVTHLMKLTASQKTGAKIAQIVVEEVSRVLQNLKQIAEEEAILLIFLYTREGRLMPELYKVVERNFKSTRYSTTSVIVLGNKMAAITSKTIWLLNRMVSESDFKRLSQQKSFRMQFISKLSAEQKQAVWSALFPEKVKNIQALTGWSAFLQKNLSVSKNLQQKTALFMEDLLISQLSDQWQNTDNIKLYQKIFLFIAETSSENPLELITTLKFNEITSSTHFSAENNSQWKSITNKIRGIIEEETKEEGTKNSVFSTINNWAEEVVNFLLTGRSTFAGTVTKAQFNKHTAEVIAYFLGGEKTEESWQPRSYYQSVIQEKIDKISVLEIALITERILKLDIQSEKKEELLQFALAKHNLAEVVSSNDGSSVIIWSQKEANLDFLVQYLLKFERLPLGFSAMMDPAQFLTIASLLFKEKLVNISTNLAVTPLSQLLLKLEKLADTSVTARDLEAITLVLAKANEQITTKADLRTISRQKLQTAVSQVYQIIQKQVATTNVAASQDEMKEKAKGPEARNIEQKVENISNIEGSEATKKPQKTAQLSEELEKLAEKELENSLFIQNAGIVLLAPYLPRIFDKLQLLNKEGLFKTDESKIKAVEVIHFLTFGTEEMMEYTTTLNKLMVAMPVSTPLETTISLTAEDKALCESLLNGVLQNWPSLKSSSIDNLRGTFLIREGKLTSHDEKYLLKVEEKGFDMLIDKVPWSFKLVKYKWMKKPIFVEWR